MGHLVLLNMLHELGTHRYILGTLNGTLKTYPNLAFDVVGIKDVAMAHTLAYESGHAMGQYICSGLVLHFADLILHLIYDISVRDPHKTVSRVPPYNLSSQKLRDFGLHFQPVEDVIHESVIEIEESWDCWINNIANIQDARGTFLLLWSRLAYLKLILQQVNCHKYHVI